MAGEVTEQLLGHGTAAKPNMAASGLAHIRTIARFCVTMFLVSRPGLYIFTGFLYFIPAAPDPSVLSSQRAILGFLFVVGPMNLCVYAMNDYKDVDIDAKNPRKGGLHGAKASASDLRMCLAIAIVMMIVLPPLLTNDLLWSLAFTATGLSVNWVYNFGPQWSRVPLLDMIPPLGYLLVVPFSAKVLGDRSHLQPWFCVFLVVVVLRTQLWFQRMDLEADAAEGKRTTAVFVGPIAAAVGVLGFMAGEVAAAGLWGCWAAQAWSGYSAIVFVVELIRGSKSMTKVLMAIGGALGLVPGLQCLMSS